MKECADCFAVAVCEGGSPYASEVNHGSIWKIDERICYQAKATLEWMIWDTYQHTGKEVMRMTLSRSADQRPEDPVWQTEFLCGFG